jgi:hypothetical protein
MVMAEDSRQNADNQGGDFCPAAPAVMSGEACVKCGFRCIQGCV